MISIFVVISILFWIYSYGFTDLNLTLSSNHYIYSFITWAQKLVYFDRPLSLKVYISFIFAFFLTYVLILARYRHKHTKHKHVTRHTSNHISNNNSIRKLYIKVLLIALIFTFAYPLLSHDSFKYLFSAKMVIKYGVNPHTHSPNYIQQDDWLRFTRWVHTPSPYGPVFTLITIPAYILGLGKFTLSLFVLKLMNLGWYVLAIATIGKISQALGYNKNQTILNQLFFALNPLILIENLSNIHNDMPMMALFLLSFYLLIKPLKTAKTNLKSITLLILSAGIKYITIVLLPFNILMNESIKTRILKLKPRNILRKLINNLTLPNNIINILTVLFFIVPILHYKQYQPWYITWVLTMIAIHKSEKLKYISISYSLGGMLRYIKFISTGGWSGTKLYFNMLTFAPLAITVAFYALYHLYKTALLDHGYMDNSDKLNRLDNLDT